ncbi:hypothetical protein D3C78_1932480 [compost metagenome]
MLDVVRKVGVNEIAIPVDRAGDPGVTLSNGRRAAVKAAAVILDALAQVACHLCNAFAEGL